MTQGGAKPSLAAVVFALLFSAEACAFAQTPEQERTKDLGAAAELLTWEAEKKAADIAAHKAASERLLKQREIVLTKYRDSIDICVIYPLEMQMWAYRGVRECFVGKMPIEVLYVNPLGWLTMIARARIRGCSDVRINIDPIAGIAYAFDYNVETKEQSKGANRAYLRQPGAD